MAVRVYLLFLAGVVGACAHPPAEQAPAQAQPLSWDEYTRRYPDTYIATVDHGLAAAKQRLEEAGLASDLAVVRAAVDRYLPPGNYTLRATGSTPAILRRQRVDTIAQWLVETGYRGSAVIHPGRAAELVHRAARVFSDLEKDDAAWLAPTVVLAEFIDVVTLPPRPGGLRFSSLRYRVLEPLKDSPPPGTVIQVPGGPVRYPDGTQSMSTADLESIRAGRYVLFLSQPKLKALTREQMPVTTYARVFGPLRERDGKLVPVGESAMPEVTLDDLRAVVRAQLCAEGHLLIGSEGNSLHC